jgi:hypothetical protein
MAETMAHARAPYDYADAFEIAVSESDGRSAEEFVRPAVMRVLWTVVGPLHRSLARYLLARAAAMTKERV